MILDIVTVVCASKAIDRIAGFKVNVKKPISRPCTTGLLFGDLAVTTL
jgi:hypothetical protein